MQIIDFFTGLFETHLWPARWHCGYWSDFHGWLYIVSDLLIWVSYFLIPIIIIDYFSKRRKAIKFHKIYFLFAAFILLCGTTHFLDAMMFWIPMYRLNALIRLITAVVSLMTAYYLIKILPQAFLQKTNLELENEIARRIDVELKLADANKSLNNFAFMASHDLQEPLRKISLFASRMYEGNEEKMTTRSREYTEKIIESSDRLRQLTQDLLNLAVLDEEIRLEKTQPVKAITLAKEDLDLKIRDKNATIHIGDIPPVIGNERYLSQLFFNLIGNSLKFSSKPPVITITAEKRNELVIVEVSDNGIGMTPEGSKKIFDPFQRLNSKSSYEGSGIGLAICKKIMDIHHGSISVKSKIGEGSTFTLTLPASPV
jgi:two-component system, chemotaxis family, sensor kinase Cph1